MTSSLPFVLSPLTIVFEPVSGNIHHIKERLGNLPGSSDRIKVYHNAVGDRSVRSAGSALGLGLDTEQTGWRTLCPDSRLSWAAPVPVRSARNGRDDINVTIRGNMEDANIMDGGAGPSEEVEMTTVDHVRNGQGLA